MSKKITLVPIAMVTPTEEFIYAPSRIQAAIEVDQVTFNAEYAGNRQSIAVSLAADGKSDPVLTVTYSGKQPMMGRYIKK